MLNIRLIEFNCYDITLLYHTCVLYNRIYRNSTLSQCYVQLHWIPGWFNGEKSEIRGIGWHPIAFFIKLLNGKNLGWTNESILLCIRSNLAPPICLKDLKMKKIYFRYKIYCLILGQSRPKYLNYLICFSYVEFYTKVIVQSSVPSPNDVPGVYVGICKTAHDMVTQWLNV
jgi:hypothetical protein